MYMLTISKARSRTGLILRASESSTGAMPAYVGDRPVERRIRLALGNVPTCGRDREPLSDFFTEIL